MAEAANENPAELRGEAKKEAFHQEAESKIAKFAFTRPDVQLPDGQKIHVKLAGTDSCRASVQILIKGGDNNLHYHPNMDLIYMVLQGQIEFYGPGDKLIGVFGKHEDPRAHDVPDRRVEPVARGRRPAVRRRSVGVHGPTVGPARPHAIGPRPPAPCGELRAASDGRNRWQGFRVPPHPGR